MKKVLVMILIGVTVLTGCANKNNTDEKIKIGISQIVEFEVLDKNREGFIKALEDNGYIDGENVEIDYQNAQGDIKNTQTIAKNFTTRKKDMIFAISTPSAQGAYNSTKDIPIMISAVTDPIAAGLVKSLKEPNTNVTGTSDYIPVEKQLELIKLLMPDAKKIGVLYNTSEINSEILVDQLKEVSKKQGYEVIEAGVTSTNEVSQAIGSLTKKVDVLYAPTDQLVVSSMPIIVQKTIEGNIPIIASEKGSVKKGALATQGIDYYKLGYKTGEMAVKVLNGEDISKMSVGLPEKTEIFINEDSLRALSIEKPHGDNITYLENE
ncbi:MAG: ABC transporter substrate-binding protein [Firmicutes bacterium]|nr:ABC transporter substrate-binding protein [Bacillota bacterium]